jgi:hypothetical protein
MTSELEAALAGTLGDGADDAVVDQSGAIENDLLHALFLCLGRNQFAQFTSLLSPRNTLVESLGLCRDSNDRVTCIVVDELRFYIAQCSTNDQPRALRRSRNPLANSESASTESDGLLFLVPVSHVLLTLL